MRLCETGMDKSGLTPAPAQPPAAIQDPVADPASQVDVSMRPFQPIDSPLSQPTAGWGPFFNDEASQQGGHESKQQ